MSSKLANMVLEQAKKPEAEAVAELLATMNVAELTQFYAFLKGFQLSRMLYYVPSSP